MSWALAQAHVSLLLAATLLLFAGMVIIPNLRSRWPVLVRAPVGVAAFVLLTVLVQKILGSPLAPHFSPDRSGEQFWERLVEAAWWLVAARVAVIFGRLFVVLENRPRETRIVSDLLAGAIYIASVLAIINFSFEVPIRGLLATSGIIAIVLGLALQSTLSDVFSGIAVGLERPYKLGDLLWVEGNIEGRVLQLNWRSTQIVTGHDNVAIIPNSVMAKARMVNRSAPTSSRGDTITVKLDPRVPPEQCVGLLTAAARACLVPLAAPAPSISCDGLAGDGNSYSIEFFVGSSERLTAARAEMFTQIHRHVRHAGIALAVPGVAVLPAVEVPDAAHLLEQSDLFGVLKPDERDQLAAHFTPQWLEAGEVLIRKGALPEALFLIASGTVEISATTAQGPVMLHRLSPGESLGAIGLITETAYEITVTALTALKVYRLDKADIAAAIKIKPELKAGLEALAHRGQAALRRFATAHEEAQLEKPEFFLLRLRSFLHRLDGTV